MRFLLPILFLFPLLSFAQETDKSETPQVYWASKPIQCGTPDEIIKIAKQYGEDPFVSGKGMSVGGDGQYTEVHIIMGVNPKTGTFTIIEITSPSQACIIASGNKTTFHPPKKEGTNT